MIHGFRTPFVICFVLVPSRPFGALGFPPGFPIGTSAWRIIRLSRLNNNEFATEFATRATPNEFSGVGTPSIF
jgi:hypothetical protein